MLFILLGIFTLPFGFTQTAWVGLPDAQTAKLVFFSPNPTPGKVVWEISQANERKTIPCVEKYPGVFHCTAQSLLPQTAYSYKVTTENGMAWQGSFVSLNNAPGSFRFTAGACSFLHGNPVYEAMLQTGPQFYINAGDLHYGDIKSDQVADHLHAYTKRVLQGRPEQTFFAQTPLVYVWDDHDFCGNNSGGPSPCGVAAREAFALGIPSGTLPFPEDGIHQSFVQGRIRFILPDLRSSRSPGQLLSQTGLSWLKAELMKAHRAKEFPILVSSVPYLGTDSDSWGGAPDQRKQLAHWIDSLFENQALIIGGDAHMSGIDNGTHSQWNSTSTHRGPVVVQVAALIGFGSDKGGTYSEGGSFPNPLGAMQFASFQVIDDGGNAAAIHVQIHRVSPMKENQKILSSFSFFFPMPLLLGHAHAKGLSFSKNEIVLDKEDLPATLWFRNLQGDVIEKHWITQPATIPLPVGKKVYIELQSATQHWVRRTP